MKDYSILFRLFVVLYSVSFYANSENVAVIIGGIGDLAKKYLWDAVFHEIFRTRSSPNYRFYAASRREETVGTKYLYEFLPTSVRCDKSDASCESSRHDFATQVAYLTLKTAEDYRNSCKKMTEHDKLIVYLSIPPSAIVSALENLKNFCVGENFSTKIAVEKPFGRDKTEANAVLDFLESHFRTEEVFLVDHYLEKSAILAIPEFVYQISDAFDILKLTRAELVIEETDTVSDERKPFYDSCGVVKDVILSHLTAILLRTIPLFCSVKSPSKIFDSLIVKSTYLAQHSDFSKNLSLPSKTPTFAAFQFELKNCYSNFESVLSKVSMRSGKYFSEKVAYVNFGFEKSDGGNVDLVFLINPYPAIIWSSNLSKKDEHFDRGQIVQDPKICRLISEKLKLQHSCSFYRIEVLQGEISTAYRNVIREIVNCKDHRSNDSEKFMSFEEVRTTWKFWQPIIDSLENFKVHVYKSEAELEYFLDNAVIKDEL